MPNPAKDKENQEQRLYCRAGSFSPAMGVIEQALAEYSTTRAGSFNSTIVVIERASSDLYYIASSSSPTVMV